MSYFSPPPRGDPTEPEVTISFGLILLGGSLSTPFLFTADGRRWYFESGDLLAMGLFIGSFALISVGMGILLLVTELMDRAAFRRTPPVSRSWDEDLSEREDSPDAIRSNEVPPMVPAVLSVSVSVPRFYPSTYRKRWSQTLRLGVHPVAEWRASQIAMNSRGVETPSWRK